MKLTFVFVIAFVCLALFIGQSQVEASDKGSQSNIVMKDGHLILSSSGKKGKLSFRSFN